MFFKSKSKRKRSSAVSTGEQPFPCDVSPVTPLPVYLTELRNYFEQDFVVVMLVLQDSCATKMFNIYNTRHLLCIKTYSHTCNHAQNFIQTRAILMHNKWRIRFHAEGQESPMCTKFCTKEIRKSRPEVCTRTTANKCKYSVVTL